jgi:membrane protease YdiL (CAAX protease family)
MQQQSRWMTLGQDTAVTARIAAIAEPGFVLIAGTLIAGVVLSRAGAGSAEGYLYGRSVPDFRSAGIVLFFDLLVRYAIVLGFAVMLGLWRGRSSPATYGVTFGNRGIAGQIGIGGLVGLIASLPIQVLRLANTYLSLGPGTRFWALESRVSWNAGFWLYMAVGSFLLVPILEELYTRGYLLGRVRESFSSGGSLLIMAVFFALAHGQYHHLDILAVSDEATLFVWALILGFSVYRTGSLIPALVAHALINMPMTVDFYWVLLAVSVLALVVCGKATKSWIAGMARLFAEIDDWLPTLLAVVVFVLMMMTIRATAWMVYMWLGAFLLGVVPGLMRRSAWTAGATKEKGDGGN